MDKRAWRPDWWIVACLAMLCLILASEVRAEVLAGYDVERFADAVYRAEGGDKTQYPYGVKSIDTNGDKAYARRITINSIRNNVKRWQKAGKPKPFIEFMADRWCPAAADPVGHKNWVRNMKSLTGVR